MSETPTLVTSGLRFPEGPIAMPDGSIILVEIERATLTRVLPDGNTEVIAEIGGGPNGAAMGPGGYCYICNNGGFNWIERNERIFPGEQAENYQGGRIERVNLETGQVETLYTHAGDVPLRGPNDLVFDRSGGFWFSDHGKNRARDQDRTGVFYAHADGSSIEEVIFPLESPNGIGLSPDENELYVAETPTGRLWAFPARGTRRIETPTGGSTRRRALATRSEQLFPVRFACRRCRRRRLCGDPHRRWYHHVISANQSTIICSDAGPPHHEYLFWWKGSSDSFHNAVVSRAAC